jgi:hypothetical protein
MPKEVPVIIHQTTECPVCHGKETVSAKGVEMAHAVVAGDGFTHLENTATPVSMPAFQGAPFKAIVVHYDVCATCGMKYATKSEIMMMPGQPMTVGGQPGQPARLLKTR